MITFTSYISLAKKYRPTKFTELFAQGALTKILSYAIQHNRLAQSYLLTGIRGVGKTSSARIIAKTINCTAQMVEQEQVVPCGRCQNCQGFLNNTHPDIIEIDAASRTSVDDIREIINSSEYKPLLAKYKVFIIDEVHMLSKSAFSALLKILEEPPTHVIFIFATTEVQKIPLTIISRCQRYDLRRFTFNEIQQLLQQIIKQENLHLSQEAVNTIAHLAEGSARDAITILDQAANLVDGKQLQSIDAAMINQMLGLVTTHSVIKILQKILLHDLGGALELVECLYNKSMDLEKLIASISDLIAYCCKHKMLKNYSSPLYESYQQDITNILTDVSLSQLTIMWQIFNNGLQDIRSAHNLLITTEMLIIKAIYAQTLPKAEDLISQEGLPRR
ncbi:DNA polymerase III subunit gamma/tau N-terminal domain protein [Candidatus Trichorickettsia mobilis]|uniref:DNA polymerase III subunit gamma/tau n=1 Tax=Candidatus Trichorickettsia mobilis TaxID=1346319 RepID=A0ABZ0UTR1_9RICK|nr:DNA polymerase III subunit gamma/tau [Candidatus Trichorickettsia mobilis]WPY00580.1 DNA polymerase III subunit gamma/tau N-terminal domain protein [Candidatus Trichorickettsia mobilis]